MASWSSELARSEAPSWQARTLPVIEAWNRRLHYYSGLALLPALLLFTVSGLLLNHSKWVFDTVWPNRVESSFERRIEIPAPAPDADRAREFMRQLNLRGEVEWLGPAQQPGRFDFRVERPGRTVNVRIDLDRRTAALKQIDINGWGVVRALHEFTGVRANAIGAQRDWALTMLWSFAMDLTAAAMILMTLSGIWIWFRANRRRRGGYVALAAGCLISAILLARLIP